MADTQPLQPLLHDRMTALRAPVQVWTAPDGSIGEAAVDGVYVGDTRVLRHLEVRVDGAASEHISTLVDSASRLRFSALHRALDARGADPDVRSTLSVEANATGADFAFTITSRLLEPRTLAVSVDTRSDGTPMDRIKSGIDDVTAPQMHPRRRHRVVGGRVGAACGSRPRMPRSSSSPTAGSDSTGCSSCPHGAA